MKPRVYVDGLLMDWGEKFFDKAKFWGTPVRAAPTRAGSSRSGRAQVPKLRGGSIGRAGGRVEARAVRGRLADLVRKSPQVMVKVYGGGKGMKPIRAHLRYIARAGREGEVPIEDQEGIRLKGVEAIRELADDWQYGDVEIEETSTRREALNVVLSMPEGTDPIAVLKAARDFAAKEFSNHKYAMALHTIDTPHYDEDKDDPPSPHPHVHLVVQSAGSDGRRLNPRKADLQRWREEFAEALRAHGVDAVATSRAHRLARGRGERQAIRQMKADVERVAKAKKTEREILRRYAEVTQILVDSEDATDRVLALALAERFGLGRPTPTPPEPGRESWRRAPDLEEPPMPRGRTGTDDLER